MLMKQQQRGLATETGIPEDVSVAESLLALLGMLRRQVRLIATACIVGLAGSALYLGLAPKKYTATASVFIDFLHPTNLSAAQGVPLTIGLIDPAAVESQIDILRSERMALRAIRRLELLKNPDLVFDWNPILDAPAYLAFRLGLILPATEYEIERSVVDTVMKNSTVVREGKSQQTFLIQVSYTAQDPELAARVANAIVEAYLTDQLEARFDIAKLANQWFSDRLHQMRESVAATERAAQQFKAENKIFTVTGNLIDEQSLAQSERILVSARAALVDGRARLDRLNQIIADGGVEAAVPEALSSPLIQRLRNEYLDLVRRESDLRQRGVGPNHYVIAQVRASIAQTQRLITDELERIRTSSGNEVKTAEARVARLEREKGNSVSSVTLTKENVIHAAELDREAAAVRTLYESFMHRFQLTTQEQSYPVSNARMITTAQPPLKQSRRKGLILALGSTVGFVFGVGAAWLRENIFVRIRTGHQLAIATNAPFLGNLPVLHVNRAAKKQPAYRGPQDEGWLRAIGHPLEGASILLSARRPKPPILSRAKFVKPGSEFPLADCPKQQLRTLDPILRYAVDEPFSRFAETMRSCKFSIQQLSHREAASVVGIISVLPNEGKSTFASNFAQHLVSGGYRTLLIDSDLRNPVLSRAYGGRYSRGLMHILTEQAALDDVALNDLETTLWFLPSGVQDAIANSEDLLSSAACKGFFASARERFDFVVLDLPPLLSVVDARVAVNYIDGLVFIAEWGRASPYTIRLALSQALQERFVGCVLNKVPQREMDPYEGYY